MRRPRRILKSLLALSGALPVAAAAQSSANETMPCHDAVEVARQLGSKYEEAPVAFGLQSNGNLLQIYASHERTTWTVVSTSPDGVSCIVAAGHQWQSMPVIESDPARVRTPVKMPPV